MKIKLSQDQNTMTIDSLKYEAKPYPNCIPCDLWSQDDGCLYPAGSNITPKHCHNSNRNDNKRIIWQLVRDENVTRGGPIKLTNEKR